MENSDINHNHVYLLSVNECAEILRIRRTKIYQLIKSKVLQGVKIGYDYRIQRSSLEELIGMQIPESFFTSKPNHRKRRESKKVFSKINCTCGKVINLSLRDISNQNQDAQCPSFNAAKNINFKSAHI